jgi:hypothetical protein
MEQNGEETDKMNVWKKARDQSNRDVAEAIVSFSFNILYKHISVFNVRYENWLFYC